VEGQILVGGKNVGGKNVTVAKMSQWHKRLFIYSWDNCCVLTIGGTNVAFLAIGGTNVTPQL
jgi:hypothetical protein